MKAYQIKIDLTGSDPLIWRRVIMPADATFNRLHDIIQMVMEFHDDHLFAFDLSGDNMIVTNDEDMYQEHQDFKKNRKAIRAKMLDVPPEYEDIQRVRMQELEKVVRKPAGIKIDTYLEKYGQLHYTYDFGDNWRFLITLEKTRYDYYYGYPTLIDGAETAPPEDVGGLPGYYEFLRVYNDSSQPDYKRMTEWFQEQMYRGYNPAFINGTLKFIKYRKTEWDKLNDSN
ncbi:plasmid pRiA4b ORF-3 family protein [Barrientosiimonas marina]|uniref:Plasmid pRiA4b ORF-3 family protein n=1 Tax=Lentibacillus kimchii TaxID=1542911 RepID=A0ABW2UYJ7_9BACI